MRTLLIRFACSLALSLGLTTSTQAYAPPSTPSVAVKQLPKEAQETLALIRRGGPFPYRRDGIEFQNREGRLPRRERGYYHEYTVPTPGAQDRGARRIIKGQPQEYYYTGDHYRSFQRIEP